MEEHARIYVTDGRTFIVLDVLRELERRGALVSEWCRAGKGAS